MIVKWFYRENTEHRTHCNTGEEIKQDLVENKLVVSVLLLIFISLRGVVIFFSVENYADAK